jgi:Arc/MetJ-type ribon-helix-helix transcriptional regulator
VSEGYYASTSEVIREALHDSKIKRAVQPKEVIALKEEYPLRGRDSS